MPFDFIGYKPYSINYNSFFNELNLNRIFNDKNVQGQYLSRWMDVLKNHDSNLVKQLSTKEAIIEYRIKIQNEPEIFQLPITFSNNNILLHFRTSIANILSADYRTKSQLVPLEEFTRADGIIHWTPVNSNVDDYSKANNPILIVPYLNGKINYLVVDGNHRLTYKTQHNINQIYALIISEKSIIENSLFSSSFDKFYYIFNNEINHIGNETASGKYSDMQLMQKSFLMGNGYSF